MAELEGGATAPGPSSRENVERIMVGVMQCFSDFPAGDLALADVESGAQVGMVLERLLAASIGQRQHIGQGGVVQGKRRCTRHAARHVGDAR